MAGIRARFRLDWPGFTLDIDLELPTKGIIALFGHSGSGKTTLLRCIAGLERAPDGFLALNGEIWQNGAHWLPTHKRPLGYVFQEASLFPHLTVMGNLRYGMRRVSRERRVNLDQAIELLGIGHLLDRKPDRLSGGERSRIGIARALAVNPRLLLMDEPLAALDLQRKQDILPYLERLHDELEIPALYVSHSPDEVARLADHLVLLDGGRVLAEGPATALAARTDLPLAARRDAGVLLDCTVGAAPPDGLTRLDFAGGALVTTLHPGPPGTRLRVRMRARDIAVAIEEPRGISTQNILRGTLAGIEPAGEGQEVFLRLAIGPSVLLARITRDSARRLGLRPGMEVWALVKAVTFDHRPATGTEAAP